MAKMQKNLVQSGTVQPESVYVLHTENHGAFTQVNSMNGINTQPAELETRIENPLDSTQVSETV